MSVVLVVTTYLLARSYLLDQREASLTRQAFADANVLNSRLATAGTEVGDVLGELVPSGGADVVVRSDGAWYSSSLDVGPRDVPTALRDIVQGGEAATVPIATADGPGAADRRPARGRGREFYEIGPLTELRQALRTLAAVLAAGAAAATAAGAAFGVWASRRAVQPLERSPAPPRGSPAAS